MPDPPFVDAHVHVVDFLQRSADPEHLAAAMDEAGVGAAVVFGLPYKKKWAAHQPNRPDHYLDDEAQLYPWVATDEAVTSFVERFPDRDRLAPTVCGVEATDLDAAERVDRLLSEGPFVGVGELLLRHGRLSTHLEGEWPRADHRAVHRIVEACARHGVPLAVHQNTGATGQGPVAYLDEMTQLLDRADDRLDVVWCHAGVSGEQVAPELAALDDLMGRYPTLHLEMSWSATDRVVPSDEVAEPDGEWLELIAGHPARFVWGSDVVGDPAAMPERTARARAVLDRLPPGARRQVGGENARRLWFDRA